MINLRGFTAVICGASSGIGAATAELFANAGARLILIARREDALKRVAAACANSQEHAVHVCDFSKPLDVEQLADTLRQSDRIDILVNNAGIQHVARVEDFPPERWDAIIAINLTSAFHTSRLALPAMRRANWGRIINVASVHGLVGSAQKSAYVAAKHGIVGLTKVTALETATTGITANAICPGWVLTPLVQKQVDAKAAAHGLSNEEATKLLLG